jgi:hypothetical protein
MTDETPMVRDASGRFVKRAAETVNTLVRSNGEDVHPMAKILFGWTTFKGIGSVLFWAFALLSALLLVADLLIDRHEKIGLANAVGFYGLWGFGAFALVVLAGWPLGRLLRREENYYGDASGPPDDIDPELKDTAPGGPEANV